MDFYLHELNQLNHEMTDPHDTLHREMDNVFRSRDPFVPALFEGPVKMAKLLVTVSIHLWQFTLNLKVG